MGSSSKSRCELQNRLFAKMRSVEGDVDATLQTATIDLKSTCMFFIFFIMSQRHSLHERAVPKSTKAPDSALQNDAGHRRYVLFRNLRGE